MQVLETVQIRWMHARLVEQLLVRGHMRIGMGQAPLQPLQLEGSNFRDRGVLDG